jgi:hypothetical protein
MLSYLAAVVAWSSTPEASDMRMPFVRESWGVRAAINGTAGSFDFAQDRLFG